MKLHQSQYQDIVKLLEVQNINQGRLSLVKKKGRINLQIEGIDSTFSFFRRKSVSLTKDDHQWQKSELYEINAGGKACIVADWEDLVAYLSKWLKAAI